VGETEKGAESKPMRRWPTSGDDTRSWRGKDCSVLLKGVSSGTPLMWVLLGVQGVLMWVLPGVLGVLGLRSDSGEGVEAGTNAL
jgi:hypothetical protein